MAVTPPVHGASTTCLCDRAQLMLRNGNFVSFEPSCCARLGRLEILSVSNNRLLNVDGFHNFHALVEVRGRWRASHSQRYCSLQTCILHYCVRARG